jgi:hypothetical protein
MIFLQLLYGLHLSVHHNCSQENGLENEKKINKNLHYQPLDC